MTKPTPPLEWMARVCTQQVPAVLELYAANAVLLPTYDKRDLPGAGRGVLIGRENLSGYFARFLAKKNLCGRVDTVVEQHLYGGTDVWSGLYTFNWDVMSAGMFVRARVQARYTFVISEGHIQTHHSSVVPKS